MKPETALCKEDAALHRQAADGNLILRVYVSDSWLIDKIILSYLLNVVWKCDKEERGESKLNF